jgi:hypothetical protein
LRFNLIVTTVSWIFYRSSGSSAEFKEALELHLADINEKRAKLVRELEDTRDKLKVFCYINLISSSFH